MHAGQVVEVAPVRALFNHPAHPYTRALVRSIPRIDRDVAMEPIPGSVPSLLNPPPGCRYADRCDWAEERCRQSRPPLTEVAADHLVACYGYEERRARLLRSATCRCTFRSAGWAAWLRALARPPAAGGARGRVGLVRRRGGRDAGAGGRVRLRQVHRRPLPAASAAIRPAGSIRYDGAEIAALDDERL